MFTIKNHKMLFLICVILCLFGLGFVLNIISLSVGSVYLYNILKFMFNKLLLFICVLPMVYLSSWGIISGFFGVNVKQKYLTEINKPYIYIYIFIFTIISMFLIKYNVLYADNNFTLVLSGEGQEISLTSKGVDYFSKAFEVFGNAGVMAASIKVVAKLLSQHPDMGIGPKLGYLILGSSGTLLSYNIIKSITLSKTGTDVTTTISLSNTPNIQPGGPTQLQIPDLEPADKLSELQESIYSVTGGALNSIGQSIRGFQPNSGTGANILCKTDKLSQILHANSKNTNVSAILQEVKKIRPDWNLQPNLQQQNLYGPGRGWGGYGPSSIIDDVGGDTLSQIIQLLTNVLYLNSITITLSILLLIVFSARIYILNNSNVLDAVKFWPLDKYLYWFVNRFINAWVKGSILWIYSIMFLTIYLNCVIGYALWHILAILN